MDVARYLIMDWKGREGKAGRDETEKARREAGGSPPGRIWNQGTGREDGG